MLKRTQVIRALLAFAVAGAAGAAVGQGGASVTLPLNVEKLDPPAGATLPSWDKLELTPRGGGLYDVRLLPGDGPRLSGADLRLLAPRVPKLATGSEALTRLALIQREFNRNEVHNPLPDGTDFSIANNCLSRGLLEVKLARAEAGKTTTLFHAWLTFPQEEYARLFREANSGLDYAPWDKLLADYPGVGGFSMPLDALRKVRKESILSGLDRHASDSLERLTEQKGKVKLVRTPELATYGDISRAERQPITLAKFNPPGRYDASESMKFDLTWLAHPSQIVWRDVESPRVPGTFPEIEIRFENGYRIVAADAELSRLPARRETPAVEGDVLKLVCGIGTPIIHNTATERAAELREDRPRYLMILDAKGEHLDNHLAGVDGRMPGATRKANSTSGSSATSASLWWRTCRRAGRRNRDAGQRRRRFSPISTNVGSKATTFQPPDVLRTVAVWRKIANIAPPMPVVAPGGSNAIVSLTTSATSPSGPFVLDSTE